MEEVWEFYAEFCIYSWFVNVYEAKKKCDLYESEGMKKLLIAAYENLKEYLDYRKCAEYGEFENWYRGELKLNIKQFLFDRVFKADD